MSLHQPSIRTTALDPIAEHVSSRIAARFAELAIRATRCVTVAESPSHRETLEAVASIANRFALRWSPNTTSVADRELGEPRDDDLEMAVTLVSALQSELASLLDEHRWSAAGPLLENHHEALRFMQFGLRWMLVDDDPTAFGLERRPASIRAASLET